MATLGPSVIVAHRGLHKDYPENSLSAFKAAWDAGLVWVECDIHFSADGTPYILHDETLDRTTTGQGPIAEMADAQLQTITLKNGEPIPTLADVAAAMPGHGALLVEMKSIARMNLSKDVFAALHEKPWMFQSFDMQDVEWAVQTFIGIRKSLLVEANHLERGFQSHCDCVHAEYSALNETTVVQIRAAGKRAGAWTVNNPDDIRRLARMRVEMIITDEPILATKIANE